MKRKIYLFLFLQITALPAFNQSNYEQYFLDLNLRIDYFHSGNATEENLVIDQLISYGQWAGSKTYLVDTLHYGTYMHKVYDAESLQLIYSRGFDSYFKEYQSSKKALDGTFKTFHESAIIPLPKREIIFVLEKRSKDNQVQVIFRDHVDPNAIHVKKNEGNDPTVKVIKQQQKGPASTKADIVILAEGYRAEDEQKFRVDLERFTDAFFSIAPLSENRDQFNVYGIFKPSAQAGIDEPRAGIYKNTALNASFNALGSERYLLTEDNRSMRDMAGHAPYDAIYIMVNHSRYGGGGIYNFYCTFTSDNIHSEYLMIHEFGHSFFGLADEYYTSSTAYNDFYSVQYEPSEPNITALHDPEHIKWKHLLSKGVKVPTPWEKEKYDATDYAWQKKRASLNDSIAELQRINGDTNQINGLRSAYNDLSLQRAKQVQTYLEKSKYFGKVGAFEGAGYSAKGLFRPSINCIMFTRASYFCKVCEHAMENTIKRYSR